MGIVSTHRIFCELVGAGKRVAKIRCEPLVIRSDHTWHVLLLKVLLPSKVVKMADRPVDEGRVLMLDI